MKIISNKNLKIDFNNLNKLKILEWGKVISITGSTQIFVQLIGVISSILVIRILPPKEYAYYTLANTILGTISLLSDGGISAGVIAQGGKVWRDKEKLGLVIATGLDLRKKFAAVCLFIFIPILWYLLNFHGAPFLSIIFMTISIIPAYLTALSGTLFQIAFKLQQDIKSLQIIQIKSNLIRIFFLVISLFALPFSFTAILAAGIPQLWANRDMKRSSRTYADINQKPDLLIRSNIIKIVKRILPGTIYGCIFSQISMWIISIFGSTANIAQLGALGRLSLIFAIFGSMFSTLVTPRFAKLSNNVDQLLKRYFQIHTFLFVLCLFIVGFVWIFSAQLLWVLGKDYTNLKSEIMLCIICGCINFIAASTFILYSSRGWTINPTLSISVSILSLIVGVSLIETTTLKGVLSLNIFVGSIQVLMEYIFGLRKIKSINE